MIFPKVEKLDQYKNILILVATITQKIIYPFSKLNLIGNFL